MRLYVYFVVGLGIRCILRLTAYTTLVMAKMMRVWHFINSRAPSS